MTLFARLQKLNKEMTPGYLIDFSNVSDRELFWECRKSLPAVLNLIEAVVSKCVFCSKGQPRVSMGRNGAWHQVKPVGQEKWSQLSCPLTDVEAEAVAVFVSGQEEPK